MEVLLNIKIRDILKKKHEAIHCLLLHIMGAADTKIVQQKAGRNATMQ
jgi:hypothetical protein